MSEGSRSVTPLSTRETASTAAGIREGLPRRSFSVVIRRRWFYELVYALLVLGAVSLCLSLVGRSSGWPLGAQFNNEYILVQLYAAHFRHLDFFPIWSSSDGLGMGTPVLLFYQKAFFYVSGAILVVLGGALKPTLILTVAIFLVVGAYGMRRALQVVTDNRFLQVVGSLGFLFTNYVFTDWLTRGDLPEFSAVMIVPWLLFWCLNLLKNQQVSLLLIPIMALLVDAHSAIGLVSVFTLVITMITFLVTYRIRGLRAIIRRLLVAVGGATLLLAPTLLAELKFAQYYDPASKVTHFDQVSTNFNPFGIYFYDGTYRWLANSYYEFVQIDFAIWIPIAIALIGAAVIWIVTRTRPDQSSWGRGLNMPCTLMLLASLGVYLALQLRAFYWVYEVFSPLQAIDFPSRMLAFITPIGVILVVSIANCVILRSPGSWIPKFLALGWLVSLVAISPLTATWTSSYGILERSGHFANLGYSTPPTYLNYKTYDGLFTFDGILFDEYLPKVYNSKGEELYSDSPLYKELHRHNDGAASLSSVPCTVDVPTKSPLETLSLRFKVMCAGPTRLALPVTFNGYSTVFVEGPDNTLREIPYHHISSDPRMIIKVPSSKTEVVVVHLPTLWGVLK